MGAVTVASGLSSDEQVQSVAPVYVIAPQSLQPQSLQSQSMQSQSQQPPPPRLDNTVPVQTAAARPKSVKTAQVQTDETKQKSTKTAQVQTRALKTKTSQVQTDATRQTKTASALVQTDSVDVLSGARPWTTGRQGAGLLSASRPGATASERDSSFRSLKSDYMRSLSPERFKKRYGYYPDADDWHLHASDSRAKSPRRQSFVDSEVRTRTCTSALCVGLYRIYVHRYFAVNVCRYKHCY